MANDKDLKKIRVEIQKALKDKEWARGIALLEEWCRQKPGDAKGWYYRAYFLVKLGQNEQAWSHVDRALSLDPGFSSAQKLRTFLDTQEKSRTNQERVDRRRERVWREGNVVEGRYEVHGSKRGGMGEVYFAFDRELEHMVAVKAPLATVLTSDTLKARFYREAEAWMGLGMHPNICAAYYVQEIDGIPWLFIEYIGGGTLDQWIKSQRLGFRDQLDVAIQIAAGMNHTHTFEWRDEDGVKRKGLVHRDLKPANILMDEEGVARVTDFGLVGLGTDEEDELDTGGYIREAPPDGDLETDDGDMDWEITADVHWQTVTAAGMALGTPPYMAPEQWQSAHLAGFPADIYAYGCILYDIFCRRRPFVLAPKWRHAMPAHQMYVWEKMHREDDPPDPRELNPDLDEELALIMLQCLAKDPTERPGSFEEVKETVKSLYFRYTGEVHPRPEPRASRLLADSLNNHAVSFVTIGQTRRAESALREALRIDPHHIEATMNLALYQWTFSEISSEDVSRRMEALKRTHGEEWRYQQLLGRMNLYFGDYIKGARNLLEASRDPKAGLRVLRELGVALSAAAGSSLDKKRWGDVEKVFRQVMSQGYEDPAVIAGTALAMARQGRGPEAEKFYDEARGGFPEMPFTLEQAAQTYLPGQELINSVAHNGWVNTLTITRKGSQVLIGGEDRVSVWQVPRRGETCETTPPDRSAASSDDCLKTRYLQAGLIYSAVLSPDERQLLTGGEDGVVRLWDMFSGDLLFAMKGHKGPIRATGFSPDGRYGLTGGEDATVRLWELQTGKSFTVLEGHEAAVNAVSFSDDGLYILSGGDDGTVRIWDSYAEECRHTLLGHVDRVISASFGLKGRYVVSGGLDKSVRVWDASTGREVRRLDGHAGRVNVALFSRDGRSIISAGHDKTLRIWSLKNGKLEKTIRFDNRVEAAGLSRDGSMAVVAVANTDPPQMKTICLMEIRSDKSQNLPYAVTLPVSASAADTRDSEFQEQIKKARQSFEKQDYSQTLAALTEARSVPGYARDSEALELWTRLTTLFPVTGPRTAWEAELLLGHEKGVNQVVTDVNGRRAVSASNDHTLRVWDLNTGRCLRVLEGHTGPVRAVGVWGQSRFAISGGEDKTLRLWDLDTGICTRVLMDQEEPAVHIDVSPDGRYALILTGDEKVSILDIASQIRLKPLLGHKDRVTSAAFSPDGRLAVTGSKDKTARLWDLERNECIRDMRGHPNMVTAVAFTADGQYVVTACLDLVFRKWDASHEEMPETFAGHTGPVTSLAMSSDGRYMISGSTDKTLMVWSLAQDRCVSVLTGHSDKVTGVACLRNRQRVISSSGDRTVRVWQLDWDPEIQEEAPWDERVLPFLENFLTQHMAYSSRGLGRVGKPKWTDTDFDELMEDLGLRGYGMLDPKYLARQLTELSKARQSRMSFLEPLTEFFHGIKILFYPLTLLKKPLKIIAKLLPAAGMGYLLWQNDFFGLGKVGGLFIVVFFVLIMFMQKKK